MKTIAVFGTLDTKGREHEFLAEAIRAQGFEALLIDAGGLAEPQVTPDISREQVAAAAGIDLAGAALRKDRGSMIAALVKAAPVLVSQLAASGKISGIISLGGTGGTAIATAAMRALPLGFPKVMVSTVAAGNIAAYVGVKDIVMMPSVVDVAGLNRLSRLIFRQAAAAVCAMAAAAEEPATSGSPAAKPLVVASMFGNTTRAVDCARRQLEAAGYEVLVFHATGTGGRAMESLIETGLVAGVLDLTTTEWADELVGGVFTAGPTRLEAAARRGVPAVIVPGCLDMVNFGAKETVPSKFAGRLFYQHNPQVTLLRTNAEECAELGRILAAKANLSVGPVAVMVPLRGVSLISESGQPFSNAEADAALFGALKTNLRPEIPFVALDFAINDPRFAEACSKTLLDLMAAPR